MTKVSLTIIFLAVVLRAIPFVPGAPDVIAQASRGESRPSEARSSKGVANEWTPARVRGFVLHVEAAMEQLQDLEGLPSQHGKSVPVRGTCHGDPLANVIETSFAMSRVRDFVTGKALPCYVATYLGCTVGPWIGDSAGSSTTPNTRPFARSKVTIVEQTADRVVADVVEAAFEEVTNGVIGEWDDAAGKYVEYSDEILSHYNEVSRYTITRGSDGAWRISDRKPPFEWECRAQH